VPQWEQHWIDKNTFTEKEKSYIFSEDSKCSEDEMRLFRSKVVMAVVICSALSCSMLGEENQKKPVTAGSCADISRETVNKAGVPCEDVTMPKDKEVQQALRDAQLANRDTILIAQYVADTKTVHANLPAVILQAKHVMDNLCERYKCDVSTKKIK
jgi:hypothetical protein